MFTVWSSFRRRGVAVDELVEGEVQLSPGGGEWAAFGEIVGHEWIEERETRGEDPAVGLGEEYGDAAAEWGQLVAVYPGKPVAMYVRPHPRDSGDNEVTGGGRHDPKVAAGARQPSECHVRDCLPPPRRDPGAPRPAT